MTLLQRAHELLHNRSEEKNRQYGDFKESIAKTAQLATLMGSKEITSKDVYNVMIALKLARESHAHKEDNIFDAIVYMAQMNEEFNEQFDSFNTDENYVKSIYPEACIRQNFDGVNELFRVIVNNHPYSNFQLSENDAWKYAAEWIKTNQAISNFSLAKQMMSISEDREYVKSIYPEAYYFSHNEAHFILAERDNGETLACSTSDLLAWKEAAKKIRAHQNS